LLEACKRMDADANITQEPHPTVKEAKSFAEEVVHERLERRMAALEEENRAAYKRESEKLAAFYAHRQAVAEEKFEREQRRLERIEALPEDDEARRILPALRARAKDADEARARVRRDQERRLAFLRQRAHVSPEFRLLAVAAVETSRPGSLPPISAAGAP
ncbi:MAG TPA: hypothetical protein VNL92_06055, partial [Dehalococcoidia bacterium]|nr:hypothetical protein [Dehalococcoidia bacterium]